MYLKHTHPHTYMHTQAPGLDVHLLGHRVNASQLPKQLRRSQETQYLPHDCQIDAAHAAKCPLYFAHEFLRDDFCNVSQQGASQNGQNDSSRI